MRFAQSERLAKGLPRLKTAINAVDQRLSTLSDDAVIDPALWATSIGEEEHRVRSILEGLTDEGLLEKAWGFQCDCGTFTPGSVNREKCKSCGLSGSPIALFTFSASHLAILDQTRVAMSMNPDMLQFQRNEDEVRALSGLLRAGRVTPFVGAGLTIPCGYPGWSSFLLSEAEPLGIDTSVREDIAGGAFEEAAERLLVAQGGFQFDRRIQHVYGQSRAIKGPVRHLPRLVPHSVITTNFDDTIERLFLDQQRSLTPVIGSRFAALSHAMFGTAPYLIKLHGDARDSADRVLTKSEYDQQYGSELPWTAELPKALIRLFSSTSLLFIGSGLSMDRTMAVLREAIKVPAAPTHFAIVEAPKDVTMLAERRRQLGEMRIAPIWYPHEEYSWLEPLLDIIATGAGR
jgi:hypothetical protein